MVKLVRNYKCKYEYTNASMLQFYNLRQIFFFKITITHCIYHILLFLGYPYSHFFKISVTKMTWGTKITLLKWWNWVSSYNRGSNYLIILCILKMKSKINFFFFWKREDGEDNILTKLAGSVNWCEAFEKLKWDRSGVDPGTKSVLKTKTLEL